ncbi:hypothetical protein L3Q82_011320, partial [Scortum barcoo]
AGQPPSAAAHLCKWSTDQEIRWRMRTAQPLVSQCCTLTSPFSADSDRLRFNADLTVLGLVVWTAVSHGFLPARSRGIGRCLLEDRKLWSVVSHMPHVSLKMGAAGWLEAARQEAHQLCTAELETPGERVKQGGGWEGEGGEEEEEKKQRGGELRGRNKETRESSRVFGGQLESLQNPLLKPTIKFLPKPQNQVRAEEARRQTSDAIHGSDRGEDTRAAGRKGGKRGKEELLLLGIRLSRNVLTVVSHTVRESVAFWERRCGGDTTCFSAPQIANG